MPHKNRADERAYRQTPAQRDRKRAYMREYNIRNREKRLARAKLDWANRDLSHEKNMRRKRRYGLPPGEFERIAEKQAGMCALCRVKPPCDVDHCHDTDKVRGLLCRSCNIGLGMLGDSIDGVLRAIEYLRNGK